jgi:hypothetical protein
VARLAWILIVLAACGKKPEAAAPPVTPTAPKYAADEEGFRKFLADLPAKPALWREAQPTDADFRRILDEGFYEKRRGVLTAVFDGVRERTDAELAQRTADVRPPFDFEAVTSEDLRTRAPWTKVPFRPGLKFYSVRTHGLFFHDGSTWKTTGLLFRYAE